MIELSSEIGKVIKEERTKKGISQQKLAQIVGITQTELSLIERGIKTYVNNNVFDSIINILDLYKNYNIGEIKPFEVIIRKNIEKRISINAINEDDAFEKIFEFFSDSSFLDEEDKSNLEIEIREE